MGNEKKQILMKNNVIVRAKYDLNTVENKVFQLILFNFQKYNDNTMIANIERTEIAKILNKSSQKTEKGITEILLKLRKSDIWLITEDEWSNYGFLNKTTYNKKTDIFTVQMHKEVYDLLFDYLHGYTPINLEVFFSFKSFYSQRMYELLRLWSNTKTVITYTLEELRELLMLENKYEDYRNFKRRVITPSVNELNEKSLMKVDIKENKVNRRVYSIDFIVTDNDKRKYFEGNKENEPLQEQQQKTYSNNKGKELKFMNFEQRTYDYDSLEKKLLGWEEE